MNRITAGSSALRGTRATQAGARSTRASDASFSTAVISSRTSSRQQNSIPASISGCTSSFAFSRKSREVTICFNPASSAHFNINGTPVEKFKIAGTLPIAHSPRTTTGVAFTFGSNTPTCGSSGSNIPRSRREIRSVRINRSRPFKVTPLTSSSSVFPVLFTAVSMTAFRTLPGACSTSTWNRCWIMQSRSHCVSLIRAWCVLPKSLCGGSCASLK